MITIIDCSTDFECSWNSKTFVFRTELYLVNFFELKLNRLNITSVGAGQFKREDLARSLLTCFILDLVHCVQFMSHCYGVKRVFFGGGFCSSQLVRSIITQEYARRNLFLLSYGWVPHFMTAAACFFAELKYSILFISRSSDFYQVLRWCCHSFIGYRAFLA